MKKSLLSLAMVALLAAGAVQAAPSSTAVATTTAVAVSKEIPGRWEEESGTRASESSDWLPASRIRPSEAVHFLAAFVWHDRGLCYCFSSWPYSESKISRCISRSVRAGQDAPVW